MYDKNNNKSKNKRFSAALAIWETLDLDRVQDVFRQVSQVAFSLHAKMKVLKSLNLLAHQRQRLYISMLSPGGKCCLISQSCRKAQVNPRSTRRLVLGNTENVQGQSVWHLMNVLLPLSLVEHHMPIKFYFLYFSLMFKSAAITWKEKRNCVLAKTDKNCGNYLRGSRCQNELSDY